MQAKQAATAVVVSLALPIVLAAPAEAAPYLHLSNSTPSKLALASVPRTYLSWYQQAARQNNEGAVRRLRTIGVTPEALNAQVNV